MNSDQYLASKTIIEHGLCQEQGKLQETWPYLLLVKQVIHFEVSPYYW